MSGLKELTEDATTDRQDSKRLAHLKTYTFYVFYMPFEGNLVSPSLNKIHLKLRDEKQGGTSELKGDMDRQVQLLFYNLNNEVERLQGLMDLKLAGLQSKSKIVGYCSQEHLLDLLAKAARMEIDASNIPIILTQAHPTSDLSIFSGWNEQEMAGFSEMKINSLEGLSRKWIQSAQEKVDVWRVKIKLKEDGRLEKLVGQNFQTVETGAQFQQLFMSHFSLGYHVTLSKKYQQRRRSPDSQKTNKLIYGWQRFKNFCCVGSSNMRASTGVINISYVDDKGHQLEILKHLREYDGSEESELEASRIVKSDRGILSLLVSNIDRFHGSKLEELNCKPGDGKVEIVLFEGVSKCRRIASIGGTVLLRIDSDCVEMQIGESLYRCWAAKQVRIQQASRLRVAISRHVLSC